MATFANSDLQLPGFFQANADVGATGATGRAAYDPDAQEYRVAGAGQGIGTREDAFHFAWREIEGDFLVTARFPRNAGGARASCGWMARDGLEANAAFAAACVLGDGSAALRWRCESGAASESMAALAAQPDVLRLERAGARLILSAARFGEPLQSLEIELPGLSERLQVGIFGASGEEGAIVEFPFEDVRIEVPIWEGFERYRDYLGSRLETLELATGRRRIVYSTSECIEAPNWTPDGAALIYNSKGRLYRFELATGAIAEIDTGFANRNNNDHVLSPDGRMIAISHHAEDSGGLSIIYKLPVAGGVPQRLTPRGPSFLHGWSPDGEYVVYTANRVGQFDIYRVPTDGSGAEVRLTDAPGLDDGPEYSPDGAWIYFNSTRSGLMQLWRMRPDGGQQEQVTDDAFNNWFAHFSPDGRTIVFLSYGQDVAPDKHPYYHRVMLRSMPAEGGEPRVVAYLYGGQGTINVPSWSPDGARVAFVSNSRLGVS